MPLSQTLQICVIVPVWNGARDIVQLLDALERQTAPRDSFEVIVVDNGSSDGTPDVVKRSPHVRLAKEDRPGSYAARNRGVELARAPFLLFTDADCIPEPDWIANALSRAQSEGKNALVGGKVELFCPEGVRTHSSVYDEATGFHQKWNLENGLCVTANWLCSKALMDQVGGFDASMMSGGDSECAMRLSAMGATFVYAPEMKVRHPTRASLGSLVRKKRRVVAGRWQIAKAEKSLMEFSKQIAREHYHQARWLKSSAIPRSAKPGVIGVVFALWMATQFELVRVALGAAPRRD